MSRTRTRRTSVSCALDMRLCLAVVTRMMAVPLPGRTAARPRLKLGSGGTGPSTGDPAR
jgi:hypothetical protein